MVAPVQSSQPLQLPAAPTVIYVPSDTAHRTLSKSITINSIDRQWDMFNDRCTFLWTGPLPTASSSFLRLHCLLLPKSIARMTPYVIMEVIGAGNHKMDVVCTCVSNAGSWDTWTARTDGLKALACPWTINLLDWARCPLSMGTDGAIVKSSISTRMVLDPPMPDIEKGHTLMIKAPDGNLHRSIVIAVLQNGQEVTCAQTVVTGSFICNINSQASVIIDVQEKNESTR